MGVAEDRVKAPGIALPDVPALAATNVGCRQDRRVLSISGRDADKPDGTCHPDLVGADVTAEPGQLTEFGPLAVDRAAAGGLDRVRVLKLFGRVRAAPDSADHSKVIDGGSDLLEAVLGEDGRHARSAVGIGSLTNGMAVEIECVLGPKD